VLVIVLGGLALLFLAGAGITALGRNKQKEVPVAPIDLGVASASASAMTDNPPPQEVTSAAPMLDPANPKSSPHEHPASASGGTPSPHTTPSAKPTPEPKPIPTPHPANEPPACAKARAAKGKSPPAIVAALEAQCKNAGGSL
jgi:hypothetical protein